MRVAVTTAPVLPLRGPHRGRARFDSTAEVLLYDALVTRQEAFPRFRTFGIAVHPLLRVRGHLFTPDLLLTYAGHSIAIEVDGPHHGRRWAADRSRDELLEDCGVPVKRITVEDVGNTALREAWIDRTLTRLLGPESLPTGGNA